jgi:hypothetical protein
MTRFCTHLSLGALIGPAYTSNTFNWGDPVANFNSGQFGRITTRAGAPRIIQLGVKYAF